jgi:hypothetical protein
MSDELVQSESEVGLSALHPTAAVQEILVGTSTASEFNTVRTLLRPIACWRLEYLLFDFDSSFRAERSARIEAAAGAADAEDWRTGSSGRRFRFPATLIRSATKITTSS